jgi:hypothetical protein
MQGNEKIQLARRTQTFGSPVSSRIATSFAILRLAVALFAMLERLEGDGPIAVCGARYSRGEVSLALGQPDNDNIHKAA